MGPEPSPSTTLKGPRRSLVSEHSPTSTRHLQPSRTLRRLSGLLAAFPPQRPPRRPTGPPTPVAPQERHKSSPPRRPPASAASSFRHPFRTDDTDSPAADDGITMKREHYQDARIYD
ncbi:hypothetical protein HRG_009622 [Hirsutella rhossiliensis]|uniref:Uncharacterized protein n=1 Tax=Hirsutella rhossiliensis TaxID=111463 RepID=A0A9P8SE03_9HYPO|nr:uncharacterized protein HRG_09622 [Hirsutella rhossiliensis]KAH0959161.1 hypothetical protein HRG_09622 [Hirsutella rhossiliensis]